MPTAAANGSPPPKPVLSREQALASGIRAGALHSRTGSGRRQRILARVCACPGAPRGWPQDLIAASLRARGAASHRAAAALWISTASRLESWRSRPQGAFGPGLGADRPCRAAHRRRPRSTPLGPRNDADANPARRRHVAAIDEVEVALDDALGGAQASCASFSSGGRPRRSRREVLERRMLNLLEKAGLPPPARQYVIRERDRVPARVDFAYPEPASRSRWRDTGGTRGMRPGQRDLARRNALTSRGWRVLHVTSRWLNERHGDIVAG